MFGRDSRQKIIAIVDIGSTSAGVCVLSVGEKAHTITLQRESLPLEERSLDASLSGVLKCVEAAGERALKEYAAAKLGGAHISSVYAIVGAPWSHSIAAHAERKFKTDSMITDSLIKNLATEALNSQKDVDTKNVFEASVVRVKLNGYPTSKPVGKRASAVELYVLASDCDASAKSGIQELLAKLFPSAPLVWRSSARAILSVVRERDHSDTCLIADVSAEASDFIVVRKGVLSERLTIREGALSILLAFGNGRPPEEILSLLEMLESEKCEGEACETLKGAIAKAEPGLVRTFGEAMATLASARRLPNDLLLLAPVHLEPWLSAFFSRIDFSQFTITTQPFNVVAPPTPSVAGDSRILDDPGLSIASALVNLETNA